MAVFRKNTAKKLRKIQLKHLYYINIKNLELWPK